MPPPEASADRVRELFLELNNARDIARTAEEALYAAAYQASIDGWSGRALAKAIGQHYRTVEGWIERGKPSGEPG